jgi:hypothetical protein
MWHIPSLITILKRHLLAASALKICTPSYNFLIFYIILITGQMMCYQHATLLYETYNETTPAKNFPSYIFQQNMNNRNNTFRVFSTNNYKVGRNLASNRFSTINGLLNLYWLDEFLKHAKLNAKVIFSLSRRTRS